MGAPEIINFGAPSNISPLLLDDLHSGLLARGLNFELGDSLHLLGAADGQQGVFIRVISVLAVQVLDLYLEGLGTFNHHISLSDGRENFCLALLKLCTLRVCVNENSSSSLPCLVSRSFCRLAIPRSGAFKSLGSCCASCPVAEWSTISLIRTMGGILAVGLSLTSIPPSSLSSMSIALVHVVTVHASMMWLMFVIVEVGEESKERSSADAVSRYSQPKAQ
jgi:hypothetical protein